MNKRRKFTVHVPSDCQPRLLPSWSEYDIGTTSNLRIIIGCICNKMLQKLDRRIFESFEIAHKKELWQMRTVKPKKMRT